MRHGRRSFLTVGAASLLALPALTWAGAARAASTTHVRGTIAGIGSTSLSVKTATGRAEAVGFAADTPIVGVIAATLADIKPGTYVGTAAVPGPGNTLVALEVHIFPDSMRGVGEGHRPFYLQPQSTMTNGTVGGDAAAVGSVSGRAITVNYASGEKTVRVPDGVPIVRFAPGNRAMLKPGAHVSIIADETAGNALKAARILVGENGVTPPV